MRVLLVGACSHVSVRGPPSAAGPATAMGAWPRAVLSGEVAGGCLTAPEAGGRSPATARDYGARRQARKVPRRSPGHPAFLPHDGAQ